MQSISPCHSLLICFACITFQTHAFDGEGSLTSQGIERSFIYHAPGDNVAAGLPLVIVFHGFGGNGGLAQQVTGFNEVADANDLLVVYPHATVIGGAPQWNAYVDEVSGHGGVEEPDATDDLLFIDALIEWFCEEHSIDPQRIYATGHSNGAYMVYRLAVERPHVFAAVAPVAGLLWGDGTYLTEHFAQDPRPVPILHIHGDADQVVAYPDPEHDPQAFIWPLSAFAQFTCAGNGYSGTTLAPGIHRLVFCNGTEPPGPRVEMIRVEGLAHVWPDVDGLDAATEIWEFFSTYSTADPQFDCGMIGIHENRPSRPWRIHPNPVCDVLHFEHDLVAGTQAAITDIHGRMIRQGLALSGTIDVSDLPAGAYVLHAMDRSGGRRTARFMKL